MKFEIIAAGFNGGTDETDDHILWVEAETEAQVQDAIADTGATYVHLDTCLRSLELDYELPSDVVPLRQFLQARK